MSISIEMDNEIISNGICQRTSSVINTLVAHAHEGPMSSVWVNEGPIVAIRYKAHHRA